MESGRSMSFREIRESEQENEPSTSGSDALGSMFSMSRSGSVNQADLELIEESPQAAWKLPHIEPSRVYNFIM